jgi:hypothetical protein
MKFREYYLSVSLSDTYKGKEGMQRQRDMCGKIERKFFENRLCIHEWKYPPNSILLFHQKRSEKK